MLRVADKSNLLGPSMGPMEQAAMHSMAKAPTVSQAMSTPNLDLKIQLRAPYVAPLNIMQCLCLKVLREYQATGTLPGGCVGW